MTRTMAVEGGHTWIGQVAMSVLLVLLLLPSGILATSHGSTTGGSTQAGLRNIGFPEGGHPSALGHGSSSVEASVTPAAVTIPPGLLSYAPITATNGQPVATEAPFDLYLTINCNVVAGYSPADLQNIEFFDPGGNILPSWHQAGNCASRPAFADYWVDLPSGIAASSSLTFYVGFASTTASLMNDQTTGAAPTCYACTPAAPYGSYDDGRFVFPSYQSWVNLSSVPSGWTVSQSGGNSLSFGFEPTQTTVSLTSTAGGATLQSSTAALAAVKEPFVWEAYGAFDNPSNGIANSQGLISTISISESWGGANNLGCGIAGGASENFGTDTSGNHLYAIEVTNASPSNWASEVYEDGNPSWLLCCRSIGKPGYASRICVPHIWRAGLRINRPHLERHPDTSPERSDAIHIVWCRDSRTAAV